MFVWPEVNNDSVIKDFFLKVNMFY